MGGFGYVGGAGYIAVATVSGPMIPLASLIADGDAEPPEPSTPACSAHIRGRVLGSDSEVGKYAVLVDCIQNLPIEAPLEPGLRAQRVPCRLTDARAIARVEGASGLKPDQPYR